MNTNEIPQRPWYRLTAGRHRTHLATTVLKDWPSDEHFIAMVNDRYLNLFEAAPALYAVCQQLQQELAAGAATEATRAALAEALASVLENPNALPSMDS